MCVHACKYVRLCCNQPQQGLPRLLLQQPAVCVRQHASVCACPTFHSRACHVCCRSSLPCAHVSMRVCAHVLPSTAGPATSAAFVAPRVHASMRACAHVLPSTAGPATSAASAARRVRMSACERVRMSYLPQQGLPRLLPQQPAVRGDRREERLARALPHRRPSVDAQLGELRVEAHPEQVEGGARPRRPPITPLRQPPSLRQLPHQLVGDTLRVLTEVVRDVPL